jgi:hypothetical protein
MPYAGIGRIADGECCSFAFRPASVVEVEQFLGRETGDTERRNHIRVTETSLDLVEVPLFGQSQAYDPVGERRIRKRESP